MTPAHRTPRLSRRRRLLFAALLALAVLGAAEVALRVSGWASVGESVGETEAFRASVRGLLGNEAVYEADPVLFWRLRRSSPVTPTDAFGIRRFGATALAAPPGGRVLVIGDSTAYGWGVEFDETFTFQLAECLARRAARAGRPRPEVLNAAVPGYSSWQGLQALERDLLPLRPDLVLTYFGVNDEQGAIVAPDADLAARRRSAAPLVASLSRLRLVQWIRGLARSASEARGFSDRERVILDQLAHWHGQGWTIEEIETRAEQDFGLTEPAFDALVLRMSEQPDRVWREVRVPPESFIANLDRIGELVRASGGRVLHLRALQVQPEGALRELEGYRHPDALSLLDAFDAVDDPRQLFLDRSHPGAEGHARMGALLCRHIDRSGLLGAREDDATAAPPDPASRTPP